MNMRTFISFDWALKHLLREKANFDVLEGFLSTLLKTSIKIQRMLESEGNKNREDTKSNRVDMLAENSAGELLLIEVQGEPEFAYFQRMLFGASKLVTEYINSGTNYDNVKKVYSINIVYFDLGQGQDVVYHGKTEFRGIYKNDVLNLSPWQKQHFNAEEIYQLYPEYYILKVNDFNRWSREPLEQWLYFLATSEIPDDASAQGLPEARQKLRLMQMDRDEQMAYDSYLMDRAVLKNTIYTAAVMGHEEGLAKGHAKGMEEGLAKGRAEGILQIARKMKAKGCTAEEITEMTNLSLEEIDQL